MNVGFPVVGAFVNCLVVDGDSVTKMVVVAVALVVWLVGAMEASVGAGLGGPVVGSAVAEAVLFVAACVGEDDGPAVGDMVWFLVGEAV